MTSLRWTSVKLTVFTIVTIVVTTWLAMVIGNFSLLGGPYEIKAEFTDATGVLKGDVVKAAGVTVGRVTSIAVVDGVAVVTMAIDEDVDLPAGIGASIRFRNLVGQRMVTLEADEPGASGMLAGGDVIPLELTEPAFDLSELFNGLRPLIRSTNPRDINAVSEALITALSGREDAFEGFVGNVADLSEMLASKDKQITKLLDNVNIVASDLAGRDAQLRNTLAALNSFLGDVSASRGDLEVALTTLDDAATRFDRIISRNDENISQEIDDLAIIFDAVNDKRKALKGALRALPDFVISAERVTSYGQWTQTHVVHLCKDDLATCGTRWIP